MHHLARLTCLALSFLFFQAANAYSQPPQQALRKMSEFQTEKARFIYVFELSEAGIFDRVPWSEIEPIFDLGWTRKSEPVNGYMSVVVRLIDQPQLNVDSENYVGSRSMRGWRITFSVDSKGKIQNFSLSKSEYGKRAG